MLPRGRKQHQVVDGDSNILSLSSSLASPAPSAVSSRGGARASTTLPLLSVISRVLSCTWRLCPLHALLATLSALLAAAMNIVPPRILQKVVDHISAQQQLASSPPSATAMASSPPSDSSSAGSFMSYWLTLPQFNVQDSVLLQLVCMLVLSYLACFLLKSLTARLTFFIGTAVEDHFRFIALRALYEMPLAWHDRFDSTELTAKINRGGMAVLSLIETGMGGSDLLVNLLTLLFALCSVLMYTPHLWWVFVMPLPFYVISSRYFGQRGKSMQSAADALSDQAYTTLSDALSNVRAVRAFGTASFETERYKGSWSRYHQIRVLQGYWYLGANCCRQLVDFTMRGFLLLSARADPSKPITAGELVQLLYIQQMILSPLSGFNLMTHNAIRDAASASALLEFAELVDGSMEDRPLARDLPSLSTAITFEKVCFCYQGPPFVSPSTVNSVNLKGKIRARHSRADDAFSETSPKSAAFHLKDIDFTIQAGTITAIVGRSGAGKTTLAWLLCRFYHPDSGIITWDGMDMKDATQKSIRSRIAVVPQDHWLLNRSVSENIAYGKPDASLEEIIAAAKLAHAHHFIEALPNGYHTVIGEQGRRLSGGQRQRVAIARALMLHPSVLIFDESSSQLDSESEQAIQDCIRARASDHNLTQVIIAHRLSTVLHADQILCLEDHQISGRGTHQQLIQENAMYQRWYHLQKLTQDNVDVA